MTLTVSVSFVLVFGIFRNKTPYNSELQHPIQSGHVFGQMSWLVELVVRGGEKEFKCSGNYPRGLLNLQIIIGLCHRILTCFYLYVTNLFISLVQIYVT